MDKIHVGLSFGVRDEVSLGVNSYIRVMVKVNVRITVKASLWVIFPNGLTV